MKYPMLANYLLFQKTEDGEYIVEDILNDEKLIISGDMLAFAKQLDGKTDPMKIAQKMGCTRSQVLNMLQDLDAFQLLRYSRVLEKSFGNWLYTVWIMHKNSVVLRFLAFCLHILVVLSFLPVFIAGLYVFSEQSALLNDRYLFLGLFAGTLFGALLHEIAHACAAYGLGGYIFEIGLGILHFIPAGYTLLYVENIKSRLRRFAVYAAGIEINFLLAGIFLLLASYIENLNNFFFNAAIANIWFGALNLICFENTDGTRMLEIILGADDLLSDVKKIIHTPTLRRRVWNKGMYGKFAVTLCYLIYVVRIALFIFLIGINIWGVMLL